MRVKNLEMFIEKSNIVHNYEYDYSKSIYIASHTHLIVICKKHGEFLVTPNNHMRGKKCPCCAQESREKKLLGNNEDFIKNANKVHNNRYDYPRANYTGYRKKLIITCRIHGDFPQTPKKHISDGQGCNQCKIDGYKLTEEEYVDKLKQIHGDKYNYKNIGYTKLKDKVTPECLKHGEFTILASNFLKKERGCPKCNAIRSNIENEISEYVKSIYFDDIILNNRSIIPHTEIDIYIPKLKIAFEINGIYWHDEDHIDKDYHLNKTNKCESENIHLIHIYEDQWRLKKDIVKSYIREVLGLNIITYNDYDITEITKKESSNFHKNNNLFDIHNNDYNYGLKVNKELVMVMSFRKVEKNKIELLTCSNRLYTYINYGEKLLFDYVLKHLNYKNILCYLDRGLYYKNDNLCDKLGFTKIKNEGVTYYYVVVNKRIDKNTYKLKQLHKSTKKYSKIYDSGRMKYKYENKN